MNNPLQNEHYDFITYHGYVTMGNSLRNGKIQLFKDGRGKVKGSHATFYYNDGWNAQINDFINGTFGFIEYSKDNKIKPTPVNRTKIKPPEYKYFSFDLLKKEKSIFESILLKSLPKYLHDDIEESISKYKIIQSGVWTSFPLIRDEKFNTIKYLKYDDNLKREKTFYKWSHKSDQFKTDKDPSLFFGSHLIYDGCIVVFVESEKTAFLLSCFFSNYKKLVFCATGSLSVLKRPLQWIKQKYNNVSIYALPDRLGFHLWNVISAKVGNCIIIPFSDNHQFAKQDVGDILEEIILNNNNTRNILFERLQQTIIGISEGKQFELEYSKLDYNNEPEYKQKKQVFPFEIINPDGFNIKIKEQKYLQIPNYDKKVKLSENHNIIDGANIIVDGEYFTGYDKKFRVLRGRFNLFAIKDKEILIKLIIKTRSIFNYLNNDTADRVNDFIISILNQINKSGLIYIDVAKVLDEVSSIPDYNISDLYELRNYRATGEVKKLSGNKFFIELGKLQGVIKFILLQSVFELPQFGDPVDVNIIKRIWNNPRNKNSKGFILKKWIDDYNMDLFNCKKYEQIIILETMRYYKRDNPNSSIRFLMNEFGASRNLINRIKFRRQLKTAEQIYNKISEMIDSYPPNT